MSLIIAGERSGVGKTTVTLTLLAFLRRRGLQVQSFKVGPDYIDPMFHRYVTGRPCRNLDPVLTSEIYVQKCFAQYTQGVDFALIEGVMGLFDGIMGFKEEKQSNTPFASTAHIAKLLKLPVLLVIDCSRLSTSVAAIAHGYCSLDPSIKVAGLVLNRVGSDRHLQLLKNALKPLGLPIIGVLRREDNITIPDRHLGLVPTEELNELDELIERLACLGESCFDWEQLLPLLGTLAPNVITDVTDKLSATPIILHSPLPIPHSQFPIPRIAVARDRAFNFYYQDNLDLLEELGAELVFWSPLSDTSLPKNVQGLYFGGGFPEVFALELAANTSALDSVRTKVLEGVPTIAECGGLMYLCEKIIDFDGKSWPMVGVLPTAAMMDKRLTLGYRRGVALKDSLLLDAGTTVYGHEFHRSRLVLEADKPLFETHRVDCEEFTGYEGWSITNTVYASYIHMHWGARPEIPLRFLANCMKAADVPIPKS
ncbi:MAG: cobyrinate a,c-diamide synthase [Scytonematopsis contorta HA4267-MV1]|nr:cobyrinate a,c-diamide synthase [Scytonematopsis contorta HA4267-MV1]